MIGNIETLKCANGRTLVYKQIPSNGVSVLFLPGFNSSMQSIKAERILAWCRERNVGCTCFDYSGHGDSSNAFEEGSIADWLEDALAVFDLLGEQPRLLIGSSMGGWISLLLALRRKTAVKGILTIACATDFIDRVLLPNLTPEALQEIASKGITHIPTDYSDEPQPISRHLIDCSKTMALLESKIDLQIPIEMIHGHADRHIPWQISLETMQQLKSNHVRLTLVKDATHRLSRESDLGIILERLQALLGKLQ